MDTYKTCRACGQQRALIAFYKNCHAPSGYEARCKPCFNKARKAAAGKLTRSEKPCSRCKTVKPLDEFYPLKNSRDGRASYCKICVKERYREYREENPKVRLQSRLSAKIYRENRDPEEYRKMRREYYHKNKERILRQRKERRLRETMQKMFGNP